MIKKERETEIKRQKKDERGRERDKETDEGKR